MGYAMISHALQIFSLNYLFVYKHTLYAYALDWVWQTFYFFKTNKLYKNWKFNLKKTLLSGKISMRSTEIMAPYIPLYYRDFTMISINVKRVQLYIPQIIWLL